MGGVNSGTWCRGSTKAKLEDCKRIEVGKLHKDGLLKPGLRFGWGWTRDDKQIGNICIETYTDHIRLIYKWTRGDSPCKDENQRVPIDYTPCHYGGSRPWFRCPNCLKRVGLLYDARGAFSCRHCSGLAYRTQSESELDRLFTKKHKFERSISDESGYPSKPKGMHQTTWRKLMNRYIRYQKASDTMIDLAINYGDVDAAKAAATRMMKEAGG